MLISGTISLVASHVGLLTRPGPASLV